MPETTEQPTRTPPGARADEVRAVLRQRLVDGTYKLGSMLPPQRKLATEFGASYGLIDKALRPFKDAGVLHARRPGGTVVVGRIDTTVSPQEQVVGHRVLQLDDRGRVIEDLRSVIRERLASGQYPSGSPLPGQRALRREFGVSEHVVRAALAPLRADGTLYLAQGQGIYVIDPKKGPRTGRASIEHIVRQRIADGTYPPLMWMPKLQVLGAEGGVCARTASFALAELRDEKLLGTARGGMSYVIDPANPTAQPGTTAPYRRQDEPGWKAGAEGADLPTELPTVYSPQRSAMPKESKAIAVSEVTRKPAGSRTTKGGPVRDAVRQRIAEGTYRPGRVLPLRECLMPEFGVAYSTLLRALEPLKTEGLLHGHRSVGIVVSEPADTAARPSPQGHISGRGPKRLRNRNTSGSQAAVSDDAVPAAATHGEAVAHVRKVIRERMDSGRYAIGSLLPKYIEFCREFNVTEKVIREALKPFSDDGTLYLVRGWGTYVTDPKAGPRTGSRAPLAQALRARITDGTYAPLTWLPPLHVLAAEFDVSGPTASVAVQELKKAKLLGSALARTFVIDPASPTMRPRTLPPNSGRLWRPTGKTEAPA
ncbi:GntR family transcriptional regulator [Streptomyces sp. NPDC020707]|uniref:GntR family transcriptional regulator n=1 Tax=Streptomyces sp. NPDC020707 TaxID=3365084 RepID=UPI0037960682